MYLGLPNTMSRNKSAVFGYLKERVRDRIEGWNKKTQSKGGKEILMKTVAQAIPNFAMSMFLLPKQVCSEIENIMSKFWWQTSSTKDRGIRWRSWDRMCKRKSHGGLGFRKLYNFNLALLGKQGWRLITNQESLASKVFKSRYYPQGTFLTASIGSNPSYIWRSILEAQVLLKQGAVRRVGRGNTVSIKQDPWLPDTENPYIQTNHPALEGRMVSGLMKIDQDEWDTELIKDIFEDRDANLILSIPMRHNETDSWYWNKEKLGGYSVKSAYASLQNGDIQHDMSDNSGFWRRIWNLKIPHKVKFFLWRAAIDCLPTKDQLQIRRVNVNPLCPVCNIEQETVVHCLITCHFAKLCWDLSGWAKDIQNNFGFMHWMDEVMDNQSKDNSAKVAMLAWSLWKNRNEIVWKQKGVGISEVVDSALLCLNQWKSAQDRSFDNFIGFMTQADGKEHWERPQQGKVKINVDAATFKDSYRYSFSMIVRDHHGELVEAYSACKQGDVDPIMAEALGIREALSWIKRKEYTNVAVETDCLSLVQAIRCSSTNLSYLGRLVNECKLLLDSLKERSIALYFVKRSANKVAHYIARNTSSLAERIWKKGDILLDFYHVMMDDLKF